MGFSNCVRFMIAGDSLTELGIRAKATWFRRGVHSLIDEPEDWHVRRKRFDAFTATELGGLYHAYESALTNYWQIGENADPDHLMALDEKAKDATHAFVTKLMQLAGV